jgi:hypothetical protein
MEFTWRGLGSCQGPQQALYPSSWLPLSMAGTGEAMMVAVVSGLSPDGTLPDYNGRDL